MGEKTFAARLRALREGKDLSRAELSSLAHISCQALRNLERGASVPFAPTLARLAKALGVHLSVFEGCHYPEEKLAP